MATSNTFEKDKNEKLDFKFSFAPVASGDTDDPTIIDYLESDETIDSFNLTTALVGTSGCILTLSGSTLTDSNKSVLFWAAGGVLYGHCKISCLANTSASRIVERSIVINIVDK